ncbi:hypothetical protein D3C86_2000920 [compost metagenome]
MEIVRIKRAGFSADKLRYGEIRAPAVGVRFKRVFHEDITGMRTRNRHVILIQSP